MSLNDQLKVRTKEDEMDWECNTHGEREKCLRMFSLKIRREQII
jgi:hypothetical protein